MKQIAFTLQTITIKLTLARRVSGGFKPDCKSDFQHTVLLTMPLINFSLQKLEEAALIETKKKAPDASEIWITDADGLRLIEAQGGQSS